MDEVLSPYARPAQVIKRLRFNDAPTVASLAADLDRVTTSHGIS
jgi:hypothetical protein